VRAYAAEQPENGTGNTVLIFCLLGPPAIVVGFKTRSTRPSIEAIDAGNSAGPKAQNHTSLGHRPRSASPPLRYEGQRPVPWFNSIRIAHRTRSRISLGMPGTPPEMTACDGGPSVPRYRRSARSNRPPHGKSAVTALPGELRQVRRLRLQHFDDDVFTSSTRLATVSVRAQPDYQEDFEFLGLAKRKQRTFRFDAAIHPRFAVDARLAPRAVFQRVVLSRQSSVCATAFMFECMVTENNMSKENCAVLVHASDDQLRRPEYRESFELMNELGRVVNLAAGRRRLSRSYVSPTHS